MPLAKINDVLQGNGGKKDFLKKKNALERLKAQHQAIVENIAPGRAVDLFQLIKLPVMQAQQTFACGAGVQELVQVIGRGAADALIDNVSFIGRDEMFAHMARELLKIYFCMFHRKIFHEKKLVTKPALPQDRAFPNGSKIIPNQMVSQLRRADMQALFARTVILPA